MATNPHLWHLGVLALPLFVGPVTSNAEEALSLRKDHGPWMVEARVFRGVGAETYARILAVELREEYGLSAYTYRNEQQAHEQVTVLVGNVGSSDDAKVLLRRVRKTVSRRLVGQLPQSLTRLQTAKITRNPLRAN
jgi:hypothetical protein